MNHSRIARRLASMTLEEKCRLLGGASSWRTNAIPRLGIPAIKMSDGPNGVRGESQGTTRTPGLNIPTSIVVGASWDVHLALQLGVLLGREARRKAVHVVLAPTVNLHRTPIGGRTFECLSEDSELSAQLASAIVRGVQSQEVAVTVKHFAANDTEVDRMTVDALVDETVLREFYLRPFESTVIDAGAWGVMSSYNKVNGHHAANNRELLHEILRVDWGFDGFVVSDWFGAHDTVESIRAGLDVPMPGPSTIYGKKLLKAAEQGVVAEADIDARVETVLRLIERTRADEFPASSVEITVDDEYEREIVRHAAVAGTVLVRNVANALPLEPGSVDSIAVVGPNARATRTQGGGSSGMQAVHTSTILDGLRARYGDHVVSWRRGTSIDKLAPVVEAERMRTPEGAFGWCVDYFDRDEVNSTPRYSTITDRSVLTFFGAAPQGVDPFDFTVVVTGEFIPEVDGTHDVSLVITGMGSLSVNGQVVVDDPLGQLPRSREYFGFGSEEQVHGIPMKKGVPVKFEARMRTRAGFSALRIGIAEPLDTNELKDAVAFAAKADAAIVVVGTNDEWETEGHDRDSIALPGQQDELVRQIAAVNPRTIVVVNAGAPVAMPWFNDVHAILIGFFGGMEMGNAVARIIAGDDDPGGRLPVVYPVRLEDSPAMRDYAPVDGVQRYTEGEWYGWRGQAKNGVDPLIPFGFGLSYGESVWGAPRVTVDRSWPRCEVVVPVSCVSSRPATEVVQCYVRRVGDSNPPRLAGWSKRLVQPSSFADIPVQIPWTAFRRWNPGRRTWQVQGGKWEILVATSSLDIRTSLIVEIDECESAPSRGSDQPPSRLG
ncbi:MAG: glycoside hydrolase family 3 C-terminal domain-containing protein [Ilumatobacteraceae bacterium]|nr:glycoside hydrolase family 3 C-terminal domain-containing protein [Ilumatobacteraceae bacterium]